MDGKPNKPLIAKKAAMKNTEVTTIAAAFTHQENLDVSPMPSSRTPITT